MASSLYGLAGKHHHAEQPSPVEQPPAEGVLTDADIPDVLEAPAVEAPAVLEAPAVEETVAVEQPKIVPQATSRKISKSSK